MAKLNTKPSIELTKEGLEELKQELNELETIKLPAIIDRVAKAREHGDLSENSEYQSARDDQGIVEARIAEVEEVIAKAKVVKSTHNKLKVGVGSTVVLYLENKPKKEFTYTVVGEFEADPSEGKISSVSPLGQALSGKKKSDKVKVIAPAGEICYIIKEIK